MKSKEIYKGQRGKEKRDLFNRFRLRAIEDVYKNKFFALFNHQCFKCGIKERPRKEIGQPPTLCIDHHIPMALGGYLVPGNLVALCQKCNNIKLDLTPELFYTPEELEKLKPILEKQADIFEFYFDWEYWNRDREGYLLSLGVDRKLVHELLYDHEHPDFVGMPSDGIAVTISVDLNEPFKNIKER